MKRAILVLAMLTMATGTAMADRRISLDPRVALAVERDNLMPMTDEPASATASVIVQPRIDVATTPAGHPRLWRAIDTTMLIASTAALAIDWRQTRGAADAHWNDRAEVGIASMALGRTPSSRGVDCYFAAAALANVALWAVLPPRWRSVVPGVVLGVEARTIAVNLPTTSL